MLHPKPNVKVILLVWLGNPIGINEMAYTIYFGRSLAISYHKRPITSINVHMI
jgi:hypothetical protein